MSDATDLRAAVAELTEHVRTLADEVQRLRATQPRISYRVPEVVELTGVSRSELYRMVRDGDLHKAPNVGERTVVIPHTELVRRFGDVDFAAGAAHDGVPRAETPGVGSGLAGTTGSDPTDHCNPHGIPRPEVSP